MAVPLRHRVHHELGDQGVRTRLGVGIVGRAERGEADHPRVAERDQDAELRQRRTQDCGLPARRHLRKVHGGEHLVGQFGGQGLLPRPALERGDGPGLRGQGEAYGIGQHGGHCTYHPGRVVRGPRSPG